MKKILVTGACGQIGSELVPYLRERYGHDNVIATDIRKELLSEPCEVLDVLNMESYLMIAKQYEVDTVLHLAAMLSACAEINPLSAWNLNMAGLINGLEVAKELHLSFFSPSSIGAFGKESPALNTPQFTIQRPTSMYGITKVAGELLCDYYHEKYGVDTRSVRFPGLISTKTLPGGGTTDYAVEIYYEAIKNQHYVCPLSENTYLDMMFMSDALKAIVDLMEADASRLTLRNAYNISAMSLSPRLIAQSIQKLIPDFTIDYEVEPIKQEIADSWPDAMDCNFAKVDWGFTCEVGLDDMTRIMLSEIGKKSH